MPGIPCGPPNGILPRCIIIFFCIVERPISIITFLAATAVAASLLSVISLSENIAAGPTLTNALLALLRISSFLSVIFSARILIHASSSLSGLGGVIFGFIKPLPPIPGMGPLLKSRGPLLLAPGTPERSCPGRSAGELFLL